MALSSFVAHSSAEGKQPFPKFLSRLLEATTPGPTRRAAGHRKSMTGWLVYSSPTCSLPNCRMHRTKPKAPKAVDFSRPQ